MTGDIELALNMDSFTLLFNFFCKRIKRLLWHFGAVNDFCRYLLGDLVSYRAPSPSTILPFHMVLYVHSAAAAFIICAVTALPISIEVSRLHVYINSLQGQSSSRSSSECERVCRPLERLREAQTPFGRPNVRVCL